MNDSNNIHVGIDHNLWHALQTSKQGIILISKTLLLQENKNFNHYRLLFAKAIQSNYSFTLNLR